MPNGKGDYGGRSSWPGAVVQTLRTERKQPWPSRSDSRRRLLRRAGAALAGATLAPGVPHTAAETATPGVSPSDATPGRVGFGTWIDQLLCEARIPGASIAVVQDGQLVWAEGFGLRDTAARLPMTPDTLLQAASVSKPVAAVAAVLAFAQHGLSLDEDLLRLIPSLPSTAGTRSWELRNPYHMPLTLRLLLAHLGGTNDFRYAGYRRGIDLIPTMPEELAGLPPANTPAVAVVREPGTHWVYSPAGYTLVQAILMDLYDRPFAEIMQRLILDPLAMSDSTFAQPVPDAVAERMAVPYLPDGTPLPDGTRVFNTEASGGLTTTPSDLARFLIANQRALAGDVDGPIPPPLARMVMQRQPGTTLPEHCIPADPPGSFACQTSWGLGFDVNLDATFAHAADGAPTGAWFGHTGFNSGFLTLLAGSKTGGPGWSSC